MNHPETVERGEIRDAGAAVADFCRKASDLLDRLAGGSVLVAVKPAPQLFPQWEIQLRLVNRETDGKAVSRQTE